MSTMEIRKSVTKGIVCHGICRAESEIDACKVMGIHYQKGCAVRVTMPGRENHKKTVLGWIEGNYPHHILLRIDTERGPYTMSVNKTDIVLGEVKIKEVV